MTKAERMIMAALEAGLKVLARYVGPAVADQVQAAMAQAASEIERMPELPEASPLWAEFYGWFLALDTLPEVGYEGGGQLPQVQLCIQRLNDDSKAFKNFHRLLCERFGYAHDEKDWRRDQLSLIEHIAKQRSVELTAPADAKIKIAITSPDGTVHQELHDELIELGWTPPGEPRLETCPTCFSIFLVPDGATAPKEDPNWQKLRDLLGLDGWDAGILPAPAQIVTHVEYVAKERARLLKASMTAPAAERRQAITGLARIDPAAAGSAAREAFDNTFHKVRAEVSADWWGRIWMMAIEWAAKQADPAPRPAAPAGETLLIWDDEHGASHIFTAEAATKLLKELYDEWPGGLEEIDSLVRGLRRSDAHFGELERHLERIGLLRQGGRLFLLVIDDSGLERQIELRTEPGSEVAKELVAWMLHKQELLHRDMDHYAALEREHFGDPDKATGIYAPRLAEEGDPSPDTDMPVQMLGDEPVPLPAPGQWVEWDGRARASLIGQRIWPTCPVQPNTIIRVRFRDGLEYVAHQPEQMRWAWTRPYVAQADIVAYRVEPTTCQQS